jgi:large subunit ribosomal protein L19
MVRFRSVLKKSSHFINSRGIIHPRAAMGGFILSENFEQFKESKMSDEILRSVEAPVNPDIPQIKPGDTVSVFVRIREGNTERTQEFRGTVLHSRKGGNNANFTVRRIASNGIGVERTFLLNSPLLERVVVHRRAHVRRANLEFLRERTGKRARLKQKFTK